MYLSIIIPSYNEEERIVKTLIEVSNYLENQFYDYEIIVVDDGSKDKTSEFVEKLKLEIPNLKITNNKENRGKGYVVRQGLLEAKGQYRLFMDADNSTSIKEIEKFLPYLETYDIIIGSRGVKGSLITIPQPIHRRILGRFYSLLVQFIVELWGIKDAQCGFKLFNSKAVKDILPKCKINNLAFDSEILIIAKKLGYKIKEAPIIWANRPQTRVRFKGMVEMIFDLLKIRWSLIKMKSKFRDFK